LNTETREYSAQVSDELSGRRLDQAAAELFAEFSRSRLKQWILGGQLTVDGQQRRPRDPVLAGECLRLLAEPEPQVELAPEPIPLAIIHEDDEVLVIDKPAGLVVHPGAGNPHGTLLNALLYHRPALADVPRAGIVHRLDKDTSGLMVVAATVPAHAALVRQLEARTVRREYEAVCTGVLTAGGTVDAPIGRHPVDRLRMAVRDDGRQAVTRYRVIRRFRGHTHLLARLETGRTHQIRVHLAHVGHPLLGDPVYGGRLRLPAGASEALIEALRAFRRQALHARRLVFRHPGSGEEVAFESGLPDDFQALLAILARDAEAAGD
jgi:23S rRNA pseudouridine1911/1915/1917 synthase